MFRLILIANVDTDEHLMLQHIAVSSFW